MKVIVQSLDSGGAYIAALEPESGEHRKSLEIQKGEKLEIILPGVDSVDGVEFGEVTHPKAEPAAPADDDAAPSGEGGSGEGGDQGKGDKAPEDTLPTTSTASEKPLYLLDGEKVADLTAAGFEPSGLETPDGKTLYHYAGDTAGQSATGNADGVSVYADADDNEKPVKSATPSSEGGQEDPSKA